jgi:hypothetical protein
MARQALVILMVVIAFGILVPIYKGFGFLDARILAAYACLSLLFVAPASTEGAEAGIRALLTRIVIIVAWGWGMTVLILGTAIVTLNMVALNIVGPGAGNQRAGFIAPPVQFLAALLIFSLSASIAIAMLGSILARRFSAKGAKNILRTAFLAILLALAFGSRLLPENITLAIFDQFSTRRGLTHLAWQASAFFAVVAALLLLVILQTGPFAKIPNTENPFEGGG